MLMSDPREKKMYHSGTFNGNAVTMAAGLATMNKSGGCRIRDGLGTLLKRASSKFR